MGVCGAFVYIGADTTSATNIGLIYSSSPVLILVIAGLFFGQRPGSVAGLGVAMALLGVLTILAQGSPDTLFAVRFVVGDLWIVAAASGWAVYSILLKHRPTGFDTLPRFFAICLAGVLILLPFTVAEHLGGEPVAWTWETVGWMVLLAAIPGVGALRGLCLHRRATGSGQGRPDPLHDPGNRRPARLAAARRGAGMVSLCRGGPRADRNPAGQPELR